MHNAAIRTTAVLLTFSFASIATAQNDRVRTAAGAEAGKVTGMTKTEVTVRRGSTDKTLQVSEIEGVQFAGEPSELTQARVNARNGGYRVAAEKLASLDASRVKEPYIRQEIEFYQAFCQAKLALLGEADIKAAGSKLNAFVRDNPNNYHYFQARQLLGDLLVSAGLYSSAEKMYAELARAPWPAYKMRAGVLVGRALQAQEKHAEALQRFDSALAVTDDSPIGKSQKLAAQLGKGVSLAATGKVDEGVKLVETVIRDADPADEQLLAEAYNAQGSCYVQAGKAKEALFAFLHVDLMFANSPEAHAEALYNLAPLWEKAGKPQEARAARQTLKERYASSTWAKK